MAIGRGEGGKGVEYWSKLQTDSTLIKNVNFYLTNLMNFNAELRTLMIICQVLQVYARYVRLLSIKTMQEIADVILLLGY